jgi:CheY-like chemotaxis protein
LLVEDTEINQRVAQGLLECDGHQVNIAADGYSALAMHQQNNYDLVLMDIHLPDMDGMETTRRMRRHPDPHKAGIPIVALTASMTEAEINSYHAAGIDTVLGKPLQLEQLRQLLAELPQSQANRSQAAPSPINAELPAKDQAAAEPLPDQALLLENRQLFDNARLLDTTQLLDKKLLQQHRESLGEEKFRELLELLYRQCDALFADLATALDDQDPSAMTDTAHKLAGASANFGLTALSAACREMEQRGRQQQDLQLAERIRAARELYRHSQQLLQTDLLGNCSCVALG